MPKLIFLAASAALALSAASAQAAAPSIEPALNKVITSPSAPQVAYPPICRRGPLFPRYCRRW